MKSILSIILSVYAVSSPTHAHFTREESFYGLIGFVVLMLFIIISVFWGGKKKK